MVVSGPRSHLARTAPNLYVPAQPSPLSTVTTAGGGQNAAAQASVPVACSTASIPPRRAAPRRAGPVAFSGFAPAPSPASAYAVAAPAALVAAAPSAPPRRRVVAPTNLVFADPASSPPAPVAATPSPVAASATGQANGFGACVAASRAHTAPFVPVREDRIRIGARRTLKRSGSQRSGVAKYRYGVSAWQLKPNSVGPFCHPFFLVLC